MQAVGPAPARHEATGELVDDDDLWLHDGAAVVVDRLHVLDHVVDVLGEDVVGLERLVDEVRGSMLAGSDRFSTPSNRSQWATPCSVRETVLAFSSTMKSPSACSSISESLPSTMVAARAEPGNDALHPLVERRLALRALVAPGDDQRRPRLVDQDRVDLVDDRVVMLALDHVLEAEAHVVAQVVEPELVVGAVGDVGMVGLAPRAGPERGEPNVRRREGRVVEVLDLVLDHADAEPERVVDGPHPLGVTPGQVVVDGDDVGAERGQRVQVCGQGRHERLALAGGHLGDLALVEHDAAHELDVEMPHLDGAPGRLAADGEGLGQQLVELLAVGESLAELRRLAAQGPRPRAPAWWARTR